MLDQPVFYDHETPGNIRRPKSLYDGSQQVNSVAQVYLYKLFVSLKLFGPRHTKMCLMTFANNKGADQPAHPRSLISTFVVRCLDSIMPLVSVSEISRL